MNSIPNCSAGRKAEGRRAISLSLLSVVLFPVMAGTFISCSSAMQEEHMHESALIADSVSKYLGEIETDTIGGVTHNFVRTADLKCKVKDVLHTTQYIEKLTESAGGYVTISNMSASRESLGSVQVKKDSVLEQESRTTECSITLRIPSSALDTVLTQITSVALFTDHRNIRSDDVKLKLFSNILAENRFKDYKKDLQIKTHEPDEKISNREEARAKMLEKQALADNTRIESYELAEQVNYSTIELCLYEDPVQVNSMKPLALQVTAYEPGFGEKLSDAFFNGFDLLKGLVLFAVNCWSLILLSVVAYFSIRKLIGLLNKKSVA